MSGKVLGIDLGTTNSVVAIANGKEARVLADSEGRRLIPSVVSFHPDGSILVGHEARERRLVDAKNTVYSTKRLIGRPYSSSEVQRAKERFAFDLEPTKVGGVQVRVRRGTFALPEISAMVLRHLRRVAEDALGEPCGRAVVTVPANFNELQRSATQAAGKVAGLEVLRILNEPTAATLAYGLSREKAEKVAVYDLGGGTFDITVLDLDKDVFEVVSTAGDTFLGGDDIDLMIAEKMADTCLRQHRFDARVDSQAFERMRAAAEWAKCQLSNVKEVDVTLEELFNDGGGASVDFTFHLTRLELEALIRPMIARTFDVVNDALRASGRRPKEIDSVVLVGGSTRIPMVRAMVDEFFGRSARIDIDPDLVVAQGAAIHGFTIAGEKPAPGKALARVALKKVTKQITAVREERVPRQQAFAPEEGRDDRQARVVDEGVPDAPPPIPRQATQPNLKAPAAMSPFARAAAQLETPKKEVSTPNRPAVPAAPTDAFEFGDVPTTVGRRPEVEALLAREAAERAKAAEELTAQVRLPEAREAERKPQRGGTYPGASHGSSPVAGEAKRPAAPVAVFGEPERTPEPREIASAPVVAIRTVGVVGVGAAAPPPQRDDDGLDAQPTQIAEVPKAPDGKRKRQPTLMGALPGADSPFGIPEAKVPSAPPGPARVPPPSVRPPAPPVPEPTPAPAPAREPQFELSSSAFQIDDVDPELAETLREAEAALSRPMGKRAEPARSVKTRDMGELPMPGAAPIEIGEPPAATPQKAPTAYTQPGPFAPAQPAPFAPAQPAPFAPAQPAPFAPAQPAPFAPAQPAPFGQTAPQPAARAPQPAPSPAPKPLAPRQPVVAMPDRAAPLLMDVTPLSLGVETAGGYCQQIVQRNAPIPTEKSRVFATAKDGQTEVELKICQGESNRFGENQSLGALMIGPLRQAKRGDVRIEITFMIDQNGILDVKATDMDARRAQAIRIALRGGVETSEIDAMRQRQESLFQQGQ